MNEVKKYVIDHLIPIVAIISIVWVALSDIFNLISSNTVFSSICYSIIAALIFYLIQIYLPEKKKKEAISARITDYIVHRILDKLEYISSRLANIDRDGINPELSKSIIDTGAEAYNDLFKCLDDFPQTIDGDTSKAIYALTNDQFLYDLYTLYKVKKVFPEDEEYKNLVSESYQENKVSFIKRKEELSRLVTASTESKSQMSSYTKDRLKETRGIIIEDSGDIRR